MKLEQFYTDSQTWLTMTNKTHRPLQKEESNWDVQMYKLTN